MKPKTRADGHTVGIDGFRGYLFRSGPTTGPSNFDEVVASVKKEKFKAKEAIATQNHIFI